MALGLRNIPAQWLEFLQDIAGSSGVGLGSQELASVIPCLTQERKEKVKNKKIGRSWEEEKIG